MQAALPADAAFVLWIDVRNRSGLSRQHWACVVRHSGEPIWEALPDTGNQGTRSDDVFSIVATLYAALRGELAEADLPGTAAKLYARRFAPLEKHLDGVRRLFLVPDGSLVPLEVLTNRYTISYVPSGTFLARMKNRPLPGDATVLALGNPKFARDPTQPDGSLPAAGLMISLVVPGGNVCKLACSRTTWF